MNKIKKYIIAAILVLSALLFSGCSEFIINASIDENNLMTYSYKIDVKDIDIDDINYMQVKGYMEKIQHHWESSGYDAEIFNYDDGISVYLEIKEQCDSREQAFAALYKSMTNDISPFVDVNYYYNLNYYYEDYSLNARLDFSETIDDDIYTVYPDVVGKDVDEFLKSAQCTVNISLPENKSTETDIISQNSQTFSSSLTEKINISMASIINNNANKIYEQELTAKKELEQKTMLIFFSIALVLIAALVVLIVLRKKKNAKLNDNTNQENDIPAETLPGTLPDENEEPNEQNKSE